MIKTQRLGLRLLEKEDIAYLHPLESDPEVKEFFPDGARDHAKTKDMINRFITAYTEKGLPCFLLFDLDSGEFIGRAGFGLTETGEIEVGYVLHKKFWGKGFASEAVTALLEYAKKHIDVDYIIAYADTGNIGSTRVMEKCGMTFYKKDIAKGIECKFYKISNRNKDHVEIVSYNEDWPHQAQIEIDKVRAILPGNCVIDIQHVGSTAIPGLSAKPIIDIQVAARSLDEMKVIAVPALQKIGYEYWADNPDTECMFFVKGMPPFGEKRTHHVHIVELTSKHWEGKILFRDYLISHPEVAKEYEQLKIKLAQQHTFDREQYTNAKGEFVKKVLELANGSRQLRERLASVARMKLKSDFIRATLANFVVRQLKHYSVPAEDIPKRLVKKGYLDMIESVYLIENI